MEKIQTKCALCGAEASLRCSKCQYTYYCCREHQIQDWQAHKTLCKAPQIGDSSLIEEFVKDGESPGTFRWKSVVLPRLPPVVAPLQIGKTITNWAAYSSVRLGGKVEPQVIDALSYPLSIAYGLHLLKGEERFSGLKEFNLVIMGATEKAEQRVFFESGNYYEEILFSAPYISKMNLFFVGPEISASKHLMIVQPSSKMTVQFYQGKILSFLKEMGIGLSKSSTLLVGMNTGLGSKFLPLMLSWVNDMTFLFKKQYLVLFTSANDYSDLIGETRVMREVLGGKYALEPQANPFGGMTKYQSEGNWYCNSSHIYGISGQIDGFCEGTASDIANKCQKIIDSS